MVQSRGSTTPVISIINGCITDYYNLSSSKQQAHMCVQSLSCVQLFVILWSIAHQAPLSMEVFLSRNNEVGFHSFLHDIFLTGDQTHISHTAGRFVTAKPLGKPSVCQSSHSLAVSSCLFLHGCYQSNNEARASISTEALLRKKFLPSSYSFWKCSDILGCWTIVL